MARRVAKVTTAVQESVDGPLRPRLCCRQSQEARYRFFVENSPLSRLTLPSLPFPRTPPLRRSPSVSTPTVESTSRTSSSCPWLTSWSSSTLAPVAGAPILSLLMSPDLLWGSLAEAESSLMFLSLSLYVSIHLDPISCPDHPLSHSFKHGLKRKYYALLKRLRAAKKAVTRPEDGEKPECIKTHLRNMIILPEMIGSVVGVYNGKVFNQVEIKADMVAHYLGEFSITYKPVKHGTAGIGATKSSRFVPLK